LLGCHSPGSTSKLVPGRSSSSCSAGYAENMLTSTPTASMLVRLGCVVSVRAGVRVDHEQNAATQLPTNGMWTTDPASEVNIYLNSVRSPVFLRSAPAFVEVDQHAGAVCGAARCGVVWW
jgi:hypothetical protein